MKNIKEEPKHSHENAIAEKKGGHSGYFDLASPKDGGTSAPPLEGYGKGKISLKTSCDGGRSHIEETKNLLKSRENLCEILMAHCSEPLESDIFDKSTTTSGNFTRGCEKLCGGPDRLSLLDEGKMRSEHESPPMEKDEAMYHLTAVSSLSIRS